MVGAEVVATGGSEPADGAASSPPVPGDASGSVFDSRGSLEMSIGRPAVAALDSIGGRLRMDLNGWRLPTR
jgi:hypothetical protein